MRQRANWTEGHQIQNGVEMKKKQNRMVFNGRILKMAYQLTKAKQNRFEIEKNAQRKHDCNGQNICILEVDFRESNKSSNNSLHPFWPW